MHRINVLIFGPSSFLTTLNELKPFLKFNHFSTNSNIEYDVILFHDDCLHDKETKDLINKSKSPKIYASKKKNSSINYDAQLKLPTSVKEINTIIETVNAKQKFIKNSSIKVKKYFLDKNEKKLFKGNISIILTEKEIQLIELLLINSKPISKEIILSSVWNYSVDADTHTVETHIYRLRKKISEKFNDEKFIFNNKEGYYLWKEEIYMRENYSQENTEKE